MISFSFKTFLLKSIRIMLLIHVFLSVVLTAPVTQSLPIQTTEGDDVPQKHTHYNRGIPTVTGSIFRGIVKQQANHEREVATENRSPSIRSDANDSLSPRVSQTFSQPASASRKQDEHKVPSIYFSPGRNDSVSKKEFQKLGSNQKDARYASNGSILKSIIKLPNELVDSLKDYDVLSEEEEEGEARLSTATLNPDVQLLLQKNKESPHFDSIPDYSHLEFPKDGTETQFGKVMPRKNFKHNHPPRLLAKIPEDAIGTWGLKKHKRPSTTLRPMMPKSIVTVPSETKILVNEYVRPVEPHLEEKNRTLGTRWNQSTDTRDVTYQKSSNNETRKVTGPMKAEKVKVIIPIGPNNLENRPKAIDEQKTLNPTKGNPMNSGVETVMDYPVDYLALEDQEFKEVETMKIQTSVNIKKQSTISSTPLISTDTLKIQNGTVNLLTTKSPSHNGTGTLASHSLFLEKSETISAIQNSSILLVELPKLDTELEPTYDNTKTTNLFRAKLIENTDYSESEETEYSNEQPVNSQHLQFSDKPVPGNNSTNTGSTKIDIHLEIRAPSPNPSSSELEQGQAYSVVPIGKDHSHHDHNHKYERMATENV